MGLRIYGNRALKTLPGQTTRPTPARVRTAVFNIWQGAIAGCHWLDLCAGSGAMGAEALCRGAVRLVGIEQSEPACRVIAQNWQQVSQPEQTVKLIRGDICTKLKTLQGDQFDRIYFDPPYHGELYLPVLNAIVTYDLLHPDGELAVEHDPNDWVEPTITGLEIIREKVYGQTALTFLQRSGVA